LSSKLSTEQHHLRAIFYAVAAVTIWIIGDTNMKLCVGLGMPEQEIMAIAGLSGITAIFLAAVLRGDIRHLRGNGVGGILFLCFLKTLCFLCWLTGLPHTAMADSRSLRLAPFKHTQLMSAL